MTINGGNIRKGMYILFKGEPYQVTKTDFMSPGKGSAFMRVKMRSVKSGNTQEFTYKSTESVEEIDVMNREMQFLYADESEAVFMDQRSFDQVSVPISLIADDLQLLTPEAMVYVVLYEDQPIGVRLPPKVTLEITYAEEAVAGNTVGNARKEAEVETGMKVFVPLFVKTGDKIIIDTATHEYVSRAN